MLVKICTYSNYFPTSRNFYKRTVFIYIFFFQTVGISLKNGAHAQQWKTCHYFAQTIYYNIFCSFGKYNVKSRKEGRKNENVQSSSSVPRLRGLVVENRSVYEFNRETPLRSLLPTKTNAPSRLNRN